MQNIRYLLRKNQSRNGNLRAKKPRDIKRWSNVIAVFGYQLERIRFKLDPRETTSYTSLFMNTISYLETIRRHQNTCQSHTLPISAESKDRFKYFL